VAFGTHLRKHMQLKLAIFKNILHTTLFNMSHAPRMHTRLLANRDTCDTALCKWPKQHSTKRRFFSPANWNEM
jgi:hypothetical protein